MIEHEVRTHPSSARLAREDQLAWKLAMVAADPVPVPAEVTDMVINRVIDDAAVAASLTRACAGGAGAGPAAPVLPRGRRVGRRAGCARLP